MATARRVRVEEAEEKRKQQQAGRFSAAGFPGSRDVASSGVVWV